MEDFPITPCRKREEWSKQIVLYAEALKSIAHSVGQHGLSTEEFLESGLFKSAIERLRGQQAATTHVKYAFIETILTYLKTSNLISGFTYVGGGERHDFEVQYDDEYIVCIEAKGCLDGNNTNIFKRPENAEEFIIWSLCQNPGSDPRHNAWSGIHTRLGAEIVSRRERIDGVVIWDMLCGTIARPCPKLIENQGRANFLNNKNVPPPCIYTFPSTIPDVRNNSNPRPRRLDEVRFLNTLSTAFKVEESEVISVGIEVQMLDSEIQRKTRFTSLGEFLYESRWTTIKRANG